MAHAERSAFRLKALLAGIVFHNDHWNIDMIAFNRRVLNFTKPGPLVEVAGIERGFKPNRAAVLSTSQGNSVPQDRSANALKDTRWIDIDGDHRPRRGLTETDNAVSALRHEEAASLNGAEVSRRSPIPKPPLDDVCRIVARA
jgi:hypothetical protein